MLQTIRLKSINEHIMCALCQGYYIDPVTLVECLHSFCKSCIVKYADKNKSCPICDVQIHKTRPALSMRSDKALQNIVYKLVPGLYKDEMCRRKKFQEKHEPTKVSKEELEKHFFFQDDKISMSIEYYDPQNPDGSPPEKDNPNRRYLECPGTVKIQHLKKFIIMKYGLNENFVIDIVYHDDLIPEDYTLIDVAYYYKWRKDAPMKFFYRIFKKNRVLLKRRKRKLENDESANSTSADAKMSRNDEEQNGGKNVDSIVPEDTLNNCASSVDTRSCSTSTGDIGGRVEVPSKAPQPTRPEQPKGEFKTMEVTKENDSPKQESLITDAAKMEDDSMKMEIDESKPAEEATADRKPETKENRVPATTEAPRTGNATADSKPTSDDVVTSKKNDCDEIKANVTSASQVSHSTFTFSSQSRTPSRALKPGSGSHILSVIDNLKLKHQEAASKNKILNGSTSMPKSVTETNGSPAATGSATPSAQAGTKSVTAMGHQIPSDTTITLKQVPTSKTPSLIIPSLRASVPSTTSTSLETKTSLANGTAKSVTVGSTETQAKPAVADLRQFRKGPPEGVGSVTLTRPPIIPQLTGTNRLKPVNVAVTATSASSSGSHRLPADTSAAVGMATGRPMGLSGRLSSSLANSTSGLDQQKALQMLRMPMSALTPPAKPTTPPSPATTSSSETPPSTSAATPVTAAQLPSNRLQLKVQPPVTAISPFQAAFQSSVIAQLNTDLWKYPFLGAATPPASSPKPAASKGVGSIAKTVNQGIRQIPNPSLLTKQQAAERFMMAMASLASTARTTKN